MTEKEFAVLTVPVTLWHALEDMKRMWTCRHCKGLTTILSEVCAKCGREDLEQGG